MPIDYSKWDKIEISDDSDVEVHPNVDKTSFIRWKQRDIHEKRAQRNIEIKSILVQLTMYMKLNARVDYILTELTDSQLLDEKLVASTVDEKFDKTERFNYENLKREKGTELRKGLRDLEFDQQEMDNTPCYNEMIEDLFIQIKEDHADARDDGSVLRNYIKEHRAKIDDVLSRLTIKLDDLLYQKSMLITNEDLHTGFDKTFLNKDETTTDPSSAPASAPVAPTTTSTSAVNSVPTTSSTTAVQKNEVSNPTQASTTPVDSTPATSSTVSTTSATEIDDSDDELQILPETLAFSKLPVNDFQSIAQYLIRHPYICVEQQKDALLMSAFDAQLSGNTPSAIQIIHQSLLIQYIAQLSGTVYNKDQTIRAIKLFCSKVSDSSSPAAKGFQQDVVNTFQHIQNRCKVIQQEHEEANGEGEEQIQLKALDDDTELVVTLPEPNTPEYEIFTTQIPVAMQDAVKTGSLDEVNKVFATLKIEDAENILELFDQCKVIGINAYLEDENDFKKLQDQYNDNLILEEKEENKEEKKEEIEKVFNTVDEVD